MSDIGKILAVSLEARTAKLEREFKRASDIGARSFDNIERRSKLAGQRLEQNMAKAASTVRLSLGSIATAFGAGALLGGLTQLPGALQGAVKSVAEIGRQAQRVGLLTSELQGLQFGFEQTGIEANQADAAIEEFGKRVGEAAAGTGELKAILEANGVSLRNSDGTMRSTMDLLRTYADLIRNAGSEQDRLFLADKGFSNMAMASALRNGAGAIDEMMFAARQAGAVLDDELIAKAQNVDREFAVLARTIEVFAKERCVEFIGALGDMGSALSDFAGQVANAWQQASEFWDDMVGRDVEKGAVDSLRRRLRLGQHDTAEPFPFHQFTLPGEPTVPAKPTVTTRPAAPSGGGARGGASGETGYEKILAHVREFIAAQQVEQSAVGKTAVEAARLRYEQELINQATRAGVNLTPAKRAEIEALAATMATAEQATRSLTEAHEAGQQAGQFFGEGIAGAFGDIITGASSAEDAVKGLIDQLIRALIQAALLGSGPLGGMTGGAGLFGGIKLASGGEVRGPGTSTSDSIPAMLSDGEHVIRASEAHKHRALLNAINAGSIGRFADGGAVGRLPAMAGASGMGAPVVTIAPNISVKVEGGSRGAEADAEMGKAVAKQVESAVRGLVSEELRRAGRPGNLINNRSR